MVQAYSARTLVATCSNGSRILARAYEPDGLTIGEVGGFGPTAGTLRDFIRSYHDLVGAVRDIVLPDPDVRRT